MSHLYRDTVDEKVKNGKKLNKYTVTIYFESKLQGTSSSTVGKQPATMVKYPIASQSIKDMTFNAVTTNGLPFFIFGKFGIAKMLAPMLDQLSQKLTAFNILAWTTDAYQRKIIEAKQTFSGKMVPLKVNLGARRKHHFNRINLQIMGVG